MCDCELSHCQPVETRKHEPHGQHDAEARRSKSSKRVRWDEATIRKLSPREVRARKNANLRAAIRKSAKVAAVEGRGYLCKPSDVTHFNYMQEAE